MIIPLRICYTLYIDVLPKIGKAGAEMQAALVWLRRTGEGLDEKAASDNGDGSGHCCRHTAPSARCIGYLLFVPFDIHRYHHMPYYRDLRVRYRCFITSSDVVQLYNRMVNEHLPITYMREQDFEYFIRDGLVLLCGWGENNFVQADGEWQFVLDGDDGVSMEETLQGERAMLKPEHRDLPAKFLIFYGEITDAEKYEHAKACPYFYCLFSADEDG